MNFCMHVLFQKPKSLKCIHQLHQQEQDIVKVKKVTKYHQIDIWIQTLLPNYINTYLQNHIILLIMVYLIHEF